MRSDSASAGCVRVNKRGILGVWINVLQTSDIAIHSGIGHWTTLASYHDSSMEHTTDLQVSMKVHMQKNTPPAPIAVILTPRAGGTTRTTEHTMDIRENQIEHV